MEEDSTKLTGNFNLSEALSSCSDQEITFNINHTWNDNYIWRIAIN